MISPITYMIIRSSPFPKIASDTCPICKGLGKVGVKRDDKTPDGTIRSVLEEVDCSNCNGTGKFTSVDLSTIKDDTNRITRDAFIFLTPHSAEQNEDFAQCESCRMFVPEVALDGKMKQGRCIAHGSSIEIDEDDSCGLFIPWPTPDGSPVSHVVNDHAAELIKIIPGSVTPEESGLVSRRVQCHRCKFVKGNTTCGLYDMLNRKLPNIFDLNTTITPNSCCNAQEPNEPTEDEDNENK